MESRQQHGGLLPLVPPIFRVPVEIRHLVYSYLLPCQPVSHPLPSVGITSVSHRPPSGALLKIHPIITEEILDYFYSISTWKLVFSHAFNFFRIDPDLRRLEQSPILKSIRKVEMVYFCDMLLVKSYPSFGVESFCAEIEKRAARAIEVLSEATMLRSVTVSFIDGTGTGHFDTKAAILAPLRRLCEDKPCIGLRMGQIIGPDGDDLAMFIKAAEEALGIHFASGETYDGASDDPSPSYRLLAFDVRQQTNNISSRSGFQRAIPGRTGWRGGPPAMEAHEETDEGEQHLQRS
ncbi:uncharacterized protein RCC_02574 [Ramularia collo-cygni]|uniref:Uncharacterized protein n=1 Tax=Ramularia collo-cygni TaxID=112498 RepID=A0A2D3V5H9_9PEZI|nr:uncharacterized protein RCC_02574 [Ramularia collo-cygni]CZT16739.1 uncharacterized protein RCC_02574 [Ramularia collo-cygni]